MKFLRKLLFRLLFILPLVGLSLNAFAQSDPTGESPATRTYAITNATIVQAPGTVMEQATLIIKNGLISEVGKNLKVPEYAEEIDGTDMYVYPGFIDGMSYTGAKRPKAMERPNNLFTPDPPNDYAGITPQHKVVEQVQLDESSIEGLRKVGFTISHTVPYGRMLPGSGALLLLRDATHPDEMILSEDVSMYTQFVGAPGAYPGNTLGIMAKWRNLFKNAANSKNHAELHAKNPRGVERPHRDRVLEAFFPVVAKEQPVFYNSTNALEARRAMRLQNELNFELALGNLKQAWDLTDAIKQHNAKVFMSINLPKEPKNSKEEDKSDEVKTLEERRMEFYKQYLSQYASLKEQGIKFGVSTMGTSGSKVKTNMMTIIENGLSEDDALAALTTDAAELLGISEIAGTLESGKLGNAIVTTGPYFDKDSQVKMVFVDGDKYEYEVKDKSKKKATADTGESNTEGDAILLGSWSYSFTTPEGEQTGKMIFKRENGELTGVMTSDDGTPDVDMSNISFLNNELSFDFTVDAGGQSIEIVVTGTVNGKEYEADASVAAFNFNFPITATKDDDER